MSFNSNVALIGKSAKGIVDELSRSHSGQGNGLGLGRLWGGDGAGIGSSREGHGKSLNVRMLAAMLWMLSP